MASIDGCGKKIGGKVIRFLIVVTTVIILGGLGALGKGLPGRITGGSVGCGWTPGDGADGPGIVPVPLDGAGAGDGAGDGAGVPTGTSRPLSPSFHMWSCGKS